MADVIKVGTGGVSVGRWIGLVSDAVGGFVGDILLADGSGPYRIAVSLEGGEDHPAGADIPPLVMSAFNRHVAGFEDIGSAREVVALAKSLERLWGAGAALECSMQGDGLWLDFPRARHRIDFGTRLGVLGVHGRTIVGRGYDQRSPLLRVRDDGTCQLADGTTAQVGDMPDAGNEAGDDFMLEIEADAEAVGFAARLLRATAGSMKGPAPSGGLVSTGSDGTVLVIVPMDRPSERPTLRLLPGALQVVVGDVVAFQCVCDAAFEVATEIGPGTRLAAVSGETVEIHDIGVEIRTAAS